MPSCASWKPKQQVLYHKDVSKHNPTTLKKTHNKKNICSTPYCGEENNNQTISCNRKKLESMTPLILFQGFYSHTTDW